MSPWQVGVWRCLLGAALAGLSVSAAGRGQVAVAPNEVAAGTPESDAAAQIQSARRGVRDFLVDRFPDAADEARAAYGVRRLRSDGAAEFPSAANVAEEIVVLIHGLDDPGVAWNVLAPALVRKGYVVGDFQYPNDQAIVASAKLLADELLSLRRIGVRGVRIVAHSMGCLVAREMLTSEALYAGRAAAAESWPEVVQLIMVGPPNHGSSLARFHAASEVREQLERLFRGNGGLLLGAFDGAGEAEFDLMPGSDFLTTLNQRPRPKDVAMTIIAGRDSPVSESTAASIRRFAGWNWPGPMRDRLRATAEEIASFRGGVSDGLVTIESTRLAGVDDHVIVAGNHATMIRNWSDRSDRTPAAVPVVLNRLAAARADDGAR